MSKHQALCEWIKGFLSGKKNLGFETVQMYPGYRSVVPAYGDYTIKADVLGNKYKQYIFAFVGVESYDEGISDINVHSMTLFDDFIDWLEQQNKTKNFPDFGENCGEYEIVPLQNMANLAMYMPETGTAKYMLQCAINYVERV